MVKKGNGKEANCTRREVGKEGAYMELVFRCSVLDLKNVRFCGCDHDDVNGSLSSFR
jgi:hypothetical protein